MTVGVVLFDLFMLVTMAAIVASSRRAWRNEHPWFDTDLPVRWRGGLPSWRGWVRVQGVVAPAVVVIGVLLFVIQSTGVHGGVWEAVRAIAGLGICALLVVGARIWLFNRPKRLVAPHLRHQPGMLAELGGERCQPTPTAQPRRRRGAPDQEPLPSPPPDA
jgi:hypothetical protein